MSTALRIENLQVEFRHRGACIAAVREVSLHVQAGQCVAVVGESGSGKTQLFMAVMGLLPANAAVRGSVRFGEDELLHAKPAVLNRLRGAKLSMIFQDPMTALTPHLKVGVQLAEVLVSHAGMPVEAAWTAAQAMLERVSVPEAARRLRQYPHELSGGLRQRVLIGMSLLCQPQLLIADEPTTALDVTVQAQILELLRNLRREFGLSLVLISHDLAVVGGLADRIVVMYGGRIVESAAASELLSAPRHPYSAELLRCMPSIGAPVAPRMATLKGTPPRPEDPQVGCAFAPRCSRAQSRCFVERPVLEGEEAAVACHFPLP